MKIADMFLRPVSAMTDWLGRTLTRKFILLLLGFFLLQILQLVIGVLGVPHIGEEGAHINQTGRMRMQMVVIGHILHKAAEDGAWDRNDHQAFKQAVSETDAFFRSPPGVVEVTRGTSEFELLVAETKRHWEETMRPLLVGFDPVRRRDAHERHHRYEVVLPAQVDRFNRLARMLEEDLVEDSQILALWQVIILGTSILLGVVGLMLARSTVSGPLRELITASREIASGDYQRRLNVSSRDEIGVMATTFNEMAAAIEQNNRQLLVFNPISAAIASSLSVDEIVNQILPHGLNLSESQAICLVFYGGEAGQPADYYTQNVPASILNDLRKKPDPLALDAHNRNEPAVIGDSSGLRPLTPAEREAGFRSVVCLPLQNQEQQLGELYFYRTSEDTFSRKDLDLLTAFARLAGQATYNARLHARVESMAVHDSLTGLHNRRWFDEYIQDQVRRSRRFGKPLALLLMDIDHFKRVNDRYGHPAGDAVLRRLAELVVSQLREVDAVARIGGEEIAILFPETGDVEGKHGAERIRRAVASTSFRLPEGEDIGITVSIGVASFPLCASSAEDLLARADQALYVAKQSGRNAVVLFRNILTSRIEKEPGHIAELLNQGLEAIPALVTAVAAKAMFYRGHNEVVEKSAMHLAGLLNLPEDQREALRLASQLHDIGMVTVPDIILNKTTTLTQEEWQLIREHPAVASQILEQVQALRGTVPIVRHHHERWDGGGYPDKLKGETIPYLARVLAVADAYGSMMTDWPGHKSAGPAAALETLRAVAGLQTDPEITAIFLKNPPVEAEVR